MFEAEINHFSKSGYQVCPHCNRKALFATHPPEGSTYYHNGSILSKPQNITEYLYLRYVQFESSDYCQLSSEGKLILRGIPEQDSYRNT